MFLLVDKDGIIIDISQIATVVENGIDVGGLIYAHSCMLTIKEVPMVPETVRPRTHKYVDGTFIDHVEYMEQLREEGRQEILSTTVVNLENQLLLIEGVI